MDKIRIFIVDDHKIFREGIKSLLEKMKTIEISGEAANGNEAVVHPALQDTHVILMDIDMGGSDGIQTTRIITEKYPGIRILALSMHLEDNYVIDMLEAGARGYLVKNAGKDEMIAAIQAVYKGDTYFSNEVSDVLIRQIHVGKESKQKHLRQDEIPLTKRETEILNLIAREYSNPEIAEKLFISIRTVDTHKRNLLEKLHLKNTAGLVKFALKQGLVE